MKPLHSTTTISSSFDTIIDSSMFKAINLSSHPEKLLQYGVPAGYAPLLDRLAMSRAVSKTELQIVCGIEQGIWAAMRVFLTSGDKVAISPKSQFYQQVRRLADRLGVGMFDLPASLRSKPDAKLVFMESQPDKTDVWHSASGLGQSWIGVRIFSSRTVEAVTRSIPRLHRGIIHLHALWVPGAGLGVLEADSEIIQEIEKVVGYATMHPCKMTQALADYWISQSVVSAGFAAQISVKSHLNPALFSSRIAAVRKDPILEVLKTVRNAPALSQEMFDFSAGLPLLTPFPIDEMAAAWQHRIEEPQGDWLDNPRSFGDSELINWFINLFQNEGITNAAASTTMLTMGSQEAINLTLAVPANVRGATIGVDAIRYIAVSEVMALHIPDVQQALFARRENGNLDVEAVAAWLASGKPLDWLYVIPDGHNPMGTSMPQPDRERLVALAREYQFYVIEDVPYRFLKLDAKSDTTTLLGALDDPWDPRVITTLSLSKILAPGFRLAGVTGPEKVIRKMANARLDYARPSLISEQLAAAYLSRHGLIHLESLTGHYRDQRDAMVTALNTWFSDLHITVPDSGFFMFITLNEGLDAMDFLHYAWPNFGVAFVPGAPFGGASNTIRLSYSQSNPATISEGIKRLKTALDTYLKLA